MNLVEHDDVMVQLFLQTLIGKSYEWYMSLPINFISTFYDLEATILTMYSPPIEYHTLLTQFTQIH
jgi:hypothetical protein